MSTVDTVISAAQREIGKPYVFGTAGPSTFDCSGLITYIFGRVGISLPHNAAEQQRSSQVVRVTTPQPGDLVFYGNPATHVALYVGNGQQIAAPHAGANVKQQAVSKGAMYGRVKGLGLGSIPAVGAVTGTASTVGVGLLDSTFDMDKWFGKIQGTSMNLAFGLLGIGLIGGGVILAVSPKAAGAAKSLIGMGE